MLENFEDIVFDRGFFFRLSHFTSCKSRCVVERDRQRFEVHMFYKVKIHMMPILF